MLQLAFRALRWLVDVQTSSEAQFEPVGTEGWYPRGGKKAVFDPQPIEAAGLIDACLEAFRISQDRFWSGRAQWCFGWFLGDNDLRQPICDQRTGGSADALGPDGINENQGAESTLSWLTSLIANQAPPAYFGHGGRASRASGAGCRVPDRSRCRRHRSRG